MADSGGVGAVLDDGYPLVVGADDDVGSVVTYRYRIDVVVGENRVGSRFVIFSVSGISVYQYSGQESVVGTGSIGAYI